MSERLFDPEYIGIIITAILDVYLQLLPPPDIFLDELSRVSLHETWEWNFLRKRWSLKWKVDSKTSRSSARVDVYKKIKTRPVSSLSYHHHLLSSPSSWPFLRIRPSTSLCTILVLRVRARLPVMLVWLRLSGPPSPNPLNLRGLEPWILFLVYQIEI